MTDRRMNRNIVIPHFVDFGICFKMLKINLKKKKIPITDKYQERDASEETRLPSESTFSE